MTSHERRARTRSGVGKAVLVVSMLAVCAVVGSEGQWARQPGERVRNAFGPTGGVCRGACGMGCPSSSCAPITSFECAAPDRLRRVRTYDCGTHQGCRAHDDCLDRCRQRQEQGFDCDAQCHTEAVKQYGVETATAWGLGAGPVDSQRITFEYTRDAPDIPEPLFRCPTGTRLSCGGTAGRCLTDAGTEAAPVFAAYDGNPGGMRVSAFQSGRVCRDDDKSRVCEQAIDINVTGDRTWYGFEFDYANANPAAPLRCFATGAEDDFMGKVIGSAITLMPADDTTELGKLLGRMQTELGRGASLTDLLSGVKVRSAGQPPPVVEPAAPAAPGVPGSVPVPAASGHLVVPMFELSQGAPPGSTLLREVRCSHNGSPVLETTFRLHFQGR
jgi:hypothetical protein